MHEAFLKELGVREEPSAHDYVQLLRDLAHESRDTALNPNELRAVVRIVQAVAVRRGEEMQARELTLSGNLTSTNASTYASSSLSSGVGVGALDHVFVPDRDSFLREARLCVANDDEWLSVRLMGEGHGLVRHTANATSAYGGDRSGSGGGGMSLYVLHPSISLSVAAQLNIPRIRWVDLFD